MQHNRKPTCQDIIKSKSTRSPKKAESNIYYNNRQERQMTGNSSKKNLSMN